MRFVSGRGVACLRWCVLLSVRVLLRVSLVVRLVAGSVACLLVAGGGLVGLVGLVCLVGFVGCVGFVAEIGGFGQCGLFGLFLACLVW